MTIFLDEIESETIESIRQRFNPVQYGLIKSHITLCREDEIEDWDPIQNNLENLRIEKFALETGELIRFYDGKGVYLSIKDEAQRFRNLREAVLQNGEQRPREHEAHVTLMHPRNSTCDEAKFKEILKVDIPKKLSITKISLIEQEIGKQWHILQEYSLSDKKQGR